MRIFGWIIVALIALDAVGVAGILARNGARESEAWFFFLTLPMAIVVLTILYFVLRLFLGAPRAAG